LSSAEPQDTIRIGVVADTHVPDRARTLHPELIAQLTASRVSRILHAGDICIPGVLDQLAQIAPVTAVGGNRDLLFRSRLPLIRFMEIAGISMALVHGHGGFLPYLLDKWYYLVEGFRQERYINRLNRLAPEAKVIVFGHTHQPANLWQAGKLFFNPGSASIVPFHSGNPSFGILHFSASGNVHGEVIKLNGARLENRRWIPVAEGK
jgi:putative phosphoesterase